MRPCDARTGCRDRACAQALDKERTAGIPSVREHEQVGPSMECMKSSYKASELMPRHRFLQVVRST